MTVRPEPTLLEFARYNQWANRQLLNFCTGIESDVLTADIPGSAGSILLTFGHVLRAEASFLQRIHGRCPQPAFDWEAGPGLAEMGAYMFVLADELLDTIQRIPPTQNVHEENDQWTFDYQARLIFMSLIFHGIAHRTDMTTWLNSQGVPAPELDVWGYQETYPDRFEARLAEKPAGPGPESGNHGL